ncbi:MAG: hypothetical protein A2268_04915 [Candidatus Raymondbacteria bacterium RifOxyA12_full_50_37]|uniref:Type II secretion system protein GspF domain-containing protein n=1 Tax=Candidatus Raymondbacteria bacterium RIFOXYD12_FULL_49_13 TaxID=1817890 RepID=A0A1F7FDV1_UNCRA|nr:MAG: hypothetical protein A2268_04915 [Candidatus Raymondbacteria bacterium RifOxyA12_full_50_37]OGJ94085.1 MAG: hypothetical protein A2248_12120 [Candidatus Raymondbacteria bacterium RIFOXYA2_FULL_49_16]OGJ96840.1 MAG: hypothetical protein A2487_07210 [Candidatus Raymondbacteria bacterium RifOxyC12_full_50_8]OGJ96910.1 MAG: hypothetical protein A2453_04720 [Candidatus Raymondbacteria bacterium RIFOXYC2_FULL_50_21]OGK03012.1 MAG: hypothetical protein A2350_03585 [Candidatus Raymondbacteria b
MAGLTGYILVFTGLGGLAFTIFNSGKAGIRRPLVLLASVNARFALLAQRRLYSLKAACAGASFPFTFDEFLALREALALGVFLCVWFGLGIPASAAGICGALGFFLPSLKLNDIVKKRRAEFRRSFIIFLDLFLLILESGLDFGRALKLLLDKFPPGMLTDEFERMLVDMRLGHSREEALWHMAERIGDENFSDFASAVVQSDRTGGSLSHIVHGLLVSIKTRRVQAAEKMAHEAPVKLLGPLVLFIFPVVFIVLFGPIVIGLLQ